jgi:hypothetical protein
MQPKRKIIMKTLIALMSLIAVLVAPAAMANEAKIEEKAEYYFNKIDTNGDDSVSKSEHQAFGSKKFDEADTNDNDQLSLSEVIVQKRKEKEEFKDKE